MAPIVNIVSADSSWIRSGMDILDLRFFHFSAGTNIGILLFTYFLILALPLIGMFFSVVAIIRKFNISLKERYPLPTVFKMSLVFGIGFVASSLLFMLLTQVG